MTTTMITILPCLFCKNDDTFIGGQMGGYFVGCGCCEAQGPRGYYKSKAVELWNEATREAPAPAPTPPVRVSASTLKMPYTLRFLLRWICRKLVTQGPHKMYISEFYQIMREAAEAEFTEDNKPTLDHFLLECFNETDH